MTLYDVMKAHLSALDKAIEQMRPADAARDPVGRPSWSEEEFRRAQRERDAWRDGTNAILRALMRTEPTRPATLDDLPKLIEYAQGLAFRIQELEAERDRLNARWGTYGDVARPSWIDVPFAAPENVPVLMAGGAEHLRSYAVSQERVVRAMVEEVEKWRGAASTLCGAHVGQNVAPCPACALEELRAEYIDETTRFNRGWERARAGDSWDAIEDEYEQMGWAWFQQPEQSRKIASIQADLDTERGWLREARVEAEKLRARNADQAKLIHDQVMRATPPAVCVVDVNAAATDLALTEPHRGHIIDTLRNHTRRADPEAVARAMQNGALVRAGLGAIGDDCPPSPDRMEDARAALAHLGVALAEKPAAPNLVGVDRPAVAQAIARRLFGGYVPTPFPQIANDAMDTAIAEIARQLGAKEQKGGVE